MNKNLGAYESVWDVIELNAGKFFDTILEVRRIRTIIVTLDEEEQKIDVSDEVRGQLAKSFEDLADATQFVGAEVSSIAATRTMLRLQDAEDQVPILDLKEAIDDVESRLRDESQLVSFIVLNRNQKSLFGPANTLVDWDIGRLFPDAARELEEAGKCLALQRPTACVFHSMRMLEIGISKFAEFLEIPDPVKPHERNWGNILGVIKKKIEEKYTAKKRMPGSEGARAEEIYASLDAVKNPWRNGTMHVESFYSDSEALHIVNCVAFFMKKLGSFMEPENISAEKGDVIKGT